MLKYLHTRDLLVPCQYLCTFMVENMVGGVVGWLIESSLLFIIKEI